MSCIKDVPQGLVKLSVHLSSSRALVVHVPSISAPGLELVFTCPAPDPVLIPGAPAEEELKVLPEGLHWLRNVFCLADVETSRYMTVNFRLGMPSPVPWFALQPRLVSHLQEPLQALEWVSPSAHGVKA